VIGPDQLFHIGIVVEDFDRAKAELDREGYAWAPAMDTTVKTITPDGEHRTVTGRLTYSLDPIRIELLQAVDGTPWRADDVGGVHHLGYWVEALAPAIDLAVSNGWKLEWTGADDEGRPARFAYFRLPANGTRIELVDRSAIGAALERWWGGGVYNR
jgi:Glyoxalase/Bleomycin resistance protein/Dioxygenase superfamily